MTRYEDGWRDGIEAAADYLENARVSPPEAKGHWGNAAVLLRGLYKRGDLRPVSASKDGK